jgi:hypothetical protein
VSFRNAIVAGGIFTAVMLLLLAAFGSSFGPVGILLWLVAVVLGWLVLLGRARPRGTR